MTPRFVPEQGVAIDVIWENSYNESLNGTLRGELLNGEIFYSLKEAQTLIERWRQHYNTIRPHSSLEYKPPAPKINLALLFRTALHSIPFSLEGNRNRQALT